ncbi:MAG: tetratricopeptide repeat protein [bacterium]
MTRENKKQKIFEKKWVAVGLVILLSFIVYSNSFRNNFVFDDIPLVVENKAIRSLKNIPLLFLTCYWGEGKEYTGLYRPITATSFAVDYSLWKLNPVGYHFTNVFFHALNGLLILNIVLVLLKVGGRPMSVENEKNKSLNYFIALFVSLIFASHPVHTEAVTGIVGRAEVLATFFFLLSLLLYIKNQFDRKLKYYLTSLICFGCALLSKEIAITLPAIVILYDFYFALNKNKSKLVSKLSHYLGYFVTIGFYFILKSIAFSSLSSPAILGVFHQETLTTRFYTMSKVFAFYIKLLFYPMNLCADYYTFSPSYSLFDIQVIISIVVLSAIVIFAFKSYKYSKITSFAIFWFFITLLPVSHIISFGGLMGERFLYLPSVGFCLLLGAIVERAKMLKKTHIIFISIILICFSLLTIKRNFVWYDEYNLWLSTVKRVPDNARAHFNLGKACFKKGLLEEAEEEYKKVINLKPNYISPYDHLGILYSKRGWFEDAINIYIQALNINSDSAELHNHLGYAYYRTGKYAQAFAEYKRAIDINPNYASAHNNLGAVYALKGMNKEAMNEFNKALQINPGNIMAKKNYERITQNLKRKNIKH